MFEKCDKEESLPFSLCASVQVICGMSKVVEDDFDDEKVEYLDCDEGTPNKVDPVAKTPRRDAAAVKFKPLFQQKRYRGDVSGVVISSSLYLLNYFLACVVGS
jgi:hypothetical protein